MSRRTNGRAAAGGGGAVARCFVRAAGKRHDGDHRNQGPLRIQPRLSHWKGRQSAGGFGWPACSQLFRKDFACVRRYGRYGGRRSEMRMCARTWWRFLERPSGKKSRATALLEDISSNGACLQLETPVPLGVEIAGKRRRSSRRRVRYCVYREIGYFVGVEFSKPRAGPSAPTSPSTCWTSSDWRRKQEKAGGGPPISLTRLRG